jgi:superfamily II DNA or RNA helicase
MPILSRNLTKNECDEWNKHKNSNDSKIKNPISGRQVSKKSTVFKNIDKQCDVSEINKPKFDMFSQEDCLKWEKDKSRNPKTNYFLSEKSKILKNIIETCSPILTEYHKNQEETAKTTIDTRSVSMHLTNRKSKSLEKSISNDFDLHYPELDDDHFQNKIAELYSLYNVAKYPKIKSQSDFESQSELLCGEFEKTLYQYFISKYVSSYTPYKGILLYHGVGVGKTCSAITLSEGFLANHSMNEEPKIWVIMPSALQTSFKEQIFNQDNSENYDYLANQCTGDLYVKMAQILKKSNREKTDQKIKKLIKSRYRLFTYEKFATFFEENYLDNNIVVNDKVIIIDEAHNIRSKGNSVEKRVYSSLVNAISNGKNNKLVMLSATPMYDKPEDIYDLLYLLDLNDNRNILKQPFPKIFDENNIMNPFASSILKKLATNYISYLKGKNPFTFAIKLSPKDYLPKMKFLKKEMKYESNGKLVDTSYNNWVDEIEDSILLSNIGPKQKKYIEDFNSTDENHLFNRHQMNIVFENSIGEKGFSEFFITNEDANTLSVSYKTKYKNALYPDKAHLGKYSGKFLNICNIIQKSKGIVVIYSGYLWSGVLPMAVCLEHMGFNREGANNILKNPDIIENPPSYDNNKHPKYCILTSDQKEIMGNTNIDKLIKIINSEDNFDGSQIKVIFVTPVASEGLSFYNVREMHIIDPWFNKNRLEQIIGRGIRNCRHQSLPLEERNVSVFMHASYDNEEYESADITAYRIASKKFVQMKKVEKLIKDNAIDCHLMKNINYFPKSLFELGKISIRTSQNTKVDYEYGDNEYEEPQCNYRKTNRIQQNFRKDIHSHFIISLQKQLRKLVLQSIENEKWYISMTDIKKILGFDEKLIYRAIQDSLHPNSIVFGYMLVMYKKGIHISKIISEKTKKIKLVAKNTKSILIVKKYNKNKLDNISKMNIDNATIELYRSFTSDTFDDLIKSIIEGNLNNSFIAECLYKQGVLIKQNDVHRVNTLSENKYIGYVNIFNTSFEPLLYENSKYRDLTERELSTLKKNRIHIKKPNDMLKEDKSWGMILPVFSKKNNVYNNVFKLLVAGPGIGLKTGMECLSLQKKKQEEILQEMGVVEKFTTKFINCKHIAFNLMKNNRMILLPDYKPIS